MVLIERDDRQQGVARQGEVLGDVGAPVAVFLPNMMVALVVDFVFDAPMFTHGPAEAHGFAGRQAGDDGTGVLVLVFRAGFFYPFATDIDGAVRGEQLGVRGAEKFDGGAPLVDAAMVVLLFETQVKKGISSRAFSTVARRWEVLPLVPTR